MSSVTGIFRNPVLIAAFFGWFMAQLLKIPIGRYIDKKWNWKRGLSSGGMPSSHTSAVSAAGTVVGMIHGFDTPLFATIALFCVVVMYDATGVRQAAGKHAKILNEIIAAFQTNEDLPEEKLKEWIGHTAFEVFVGFWLGVLIGFVTAYLSVYFVKVAA